MKQIFSLALLVLTASAFGGTAPVYQTRFRPLPKAGESVKVYSRSFLTCAELASPVLRACPAYGVLGMRLCYVKTKASTYFVAKNEYVAHLGDYNGNDCMERFRIMHRMCKVGVESGDHTEMSCLM